MMTPLATHSPARISGRPATPDWSHHLPADWRDQVVEALDFTEHREYEMPATRCFGHDTDGKLCYYAHRFVLSDSRSDNDEDFYPVVTYGETVHAWRLRDERWLTYRQIQTGDDSAPGRAFYTVADKPPR